MQVASAISSLTFVYLAAKIIIGAIAGYMIYIDAKDRENLAFNFHPIWWGAAVFASPLLGVAAYWLLHHSQFSNTASNPK